MSENFVYGSSNGSDGEPGSFLIRSSIPGNIGKLLASFKVWDHNPVDARPTQSKNFTFTQGLDRESAKQQYPNVEFINITQDASVFLSPDNIYNDMFVCAMYPETKKENPDQDPSKTITNKRIQYVGDFSSSTTVFVRDKLPGGVIYSANGNLVEIFENGKFTAKTFPDTGRDIFPHQVWVHTGSLLDPRIYLYPSEYRLNPEQTLAFDLQFTSSLSEDEKGILFANIRIAPMWDYDRENIGPREGVVSPIQRTKNISGSVQTTQWTLTKYTPLWQGEDLLITITTDDKGPDKPRDPATTEEISNGVDVLNPEYVYLMYKWKKGYTNTYSGQGYNNAKNSLDKGPLIHGISNEAFYVPPAPVSESNSPESNIVGPPSSPLSKDPIQKADEDARSRYWWKYNNYILIELGAGHYFHNYFIELVYGRKPRFLHLGDEWDTPLRVSNQSFDTLEDQKKWAESWTWIRKCRVISEYQGATTDAILNNKGPIRFTVRNHLGYIIITFEGRDNDPWIITRQDTVPNQHYELSNQLRKEFVPMVIPYGTMKIHGGNLSCKINVSPLRYSSFGSVDFKDLQFDSILAEDKDLYMTFSHIGSSHRYREAGNFARKKWFNDPRIGDIPVSFDVDAHTCIEVNKNKKQEISLYNTFDDQYGLTGKGFIFDTPRKSSGKAQKDEDTDLPLPVSFINILKKGEEHKAHIFNLRNSNPSTSLVVYDHDTGFGKINRSPTLDYHFDFGLPNEYIGQDEFKDYISIWNVGIGLQSGTVEYPSLLGTFIPLDSEAGAAIFQNVITPIVKSWRIMFFGGVDALANTPSFDIAPLITSYSEEWNAEEWFYLEHSANASAYIPVVGTLPIIDDNDNLIDIATLGQRLYSLIDKTFFITISYWWDSGVGIKQSPGNTLNPPSSKDDPLLIQMTGLSHGGSINVKNNIIEFSFKIHDYKKILNDQYLFNSPFFDANSDVSAVHTLAQLAGFKTDTNQVSSGINRFPLSYLTKIIKEEERNGGINKYIFHNGEKTRFTSFALPGSYADVVQPAMKFENGKTIIQAIQEIAELSAKTFYFDRWGVIRFEYIPSVLAAFLGKDDYIDPVMRFTTSPFSRRAAGGQGSEASSLFIFDPKQHAAHQVFNAATYSRSVEDCITHISIFSAGTDLIRDAEGRPLGGFISEGYTFYDQLYNPNAEGFIGYRKPGVNMNGLYGGIQEVRQALKTYAKMKYPPVEMSFECYGVPGLKALDIVTLDNNLLWIKSIKHEITPSENKWWMTIEGEWYKPFKGDIDFLQRSDDPIYPSTKGNSSEAKEPGPGG